MMMVVSLILILLTFYKSIFIEISVMLMAYMFFLKMVMMSVQEVYIAEMFFYDSVSLLLVILTCLVSFLLFTGSYMSVHFQRKSLMMFMMVNIFMLVFLLLSFFSLKLIYFYIFFEASLVPIFLLVMGWGYQPERLQAGIYMLFYTLFASLPLLVVILAFKEDLEFFYDSYTIMTGGYLSIFMVMMFIMAFLVKLPMFFFHLWLPKAHVEAPVAGSMMLAGVLLKLGSYGLWRLIYSLKNLIFNMSWLILMVGLVGGLIVAFVSFLQIDMKCLVAYSSVVHMGILLSGMMSLSLLGYQGALCLMLGHGVVSSGMFYLVGTLYDRLSSRSLLVNKGMMIVFPSLTIVWFFLCIFNISAPPSVSLLGEILLTSSVLFYSTWLFWGLMLMNFMGMVFTFYLYSQSQQGKFFTFLWSSPCYSIREMVVGWNHVVIIVMMTLIFWIFSF